MLENVQQSGSLKQKVVTFFKSVGLPLALVFITEPLYRNHLSDYTIHSVPRM